MKIDKSRLKQSTSEVPSECQSLIDKLKACSRVELITELAHVETWTFGKCELYHWISILDVFDGILEEAAASQANKWYLACDTDFAEDEKHLLLSVLHFTTLLIEHSFSRHLYNSMEHLITLLSSSNMQVVLGVLNLLYMFSKRSNFITRLNSEKRQSLLCRLNYLAESWGGKEYGFGLAECCTMKQMSRNASTLYYEYFAPDGNWESIHIKDVHLSPAEYMKNISKGELSEDKMMHVFTRLRLAVGFQKYPARLQFVQARLQALSVLVYSNALQENAHTLLYPGFLEELVELLQLQLPHLVEIRAAALRTLTSIIHLDRNPHFPKKPGSRLSMIIDVTGAGSYHGFLPVLVRTCIGTLTMPKTNDETLFPLPLATALFSFLYHLASYESGGEALVSCGMMESLLRVINWPGNELEHITFVTRAVRVIDLITNIDMQAFQAHGGLNSFVSRLHMEVDLCCREQQLVPLVNIDEIFVGGTVDPITLPIPSTSKESVNLQESTNSPSSKSNRTCLPQRAALLKSMLNFLKKAIQDPAFSDSIRYVMEGTLPTSLKHIISSAEYYGPSLFLLATDVVTVYVFQEPSHLSSLQDNGLTEVVLHALLIKDVPATREVLGSLPNVFSALCLNTRGLLSFIMCKPFDRLFNVLLSPIYLAAMRRRRNSHPMSDTASNLGNAMDELMRHQPSLKGDATTAIIKLLEKLVQLGSDPQYVCWRAQSKVDISLSPAPTTRPTGPNEAGSSDEEDEDEEEVSTSSQNQREDNNQQEAGSQMNERTPIALVDYILNVMKFVDAILSNNSTDDHCKEFVFQGGLVPLLSILGLPNLPVDCPVTAAAQSVASVCKSILNLGHEPLVLQLGLEQLYRVVQSLHPLYNHLKAPGSSVLLGELANAPNVETAFSSATATPLLHAMGAAHGYIVMFVHVCRTGQSEIRTLALQKWGQDTDYGKSLLLSLVHLYTSLVWESTLLLALCSDDIIPPGCDFGKEDLDKLLPPELRDSEGPWSSISTLDCGSNGMTSAMEALSTDSLPPLTMDVDYGIASTSGNDKSKEVASRLASFAHQIKYIKPLLGASSRLGRALAELFGLLVKLCVGSPIRQRRGQVPPTPTLNNPESKEIARVLSYILVDGLAWEKLPPSPIPKFRLTFLICSVGFISPMLFDEKRYAYHLMIHMFVEEGGQASFFDTFRWALSAGGTIPLHEGLEHPNLPDGTGEFLDAWLMLLEKMVNPKSILDSPHVIPFRDRHESGFEPTQYLQQIHRLAFNAIMMMWGKKPLKCYGSRMSETILSIIRHILRGEQIIAERTTATREEAAGGTDIASVGESSSAGAYLSALQTAGPTVNPEHLKQLVDMGFTEEHCSQALRHTTTVEQATEYLLNNPPPLPRVPNSSMDVDLSEDDQMLCAIAMSLGDNGLEINAHNADSSSSKKRKNYYEAPLTEDVMSHFTKGALAACLTLLDTLPDTVYRVCVLLVTIAKRNGDTWRSNMLDSLIREIESHINYLIAIAESGKQPAEIVSELINSTISAKASVTIYLFTLLFEGAKIMDMRIPNTEVVRCAHIVPSLVKLFLLSEKFMTAAGSIPCFPKWMASLLLLINLVEKVNVVAKRRKMFDDVTNPVWGCYDYNGGKWLQYSTQNNKIINNAYDMGEDSCRVVCGRQRYHLSFNDFTQTENESYGIKYIMKLPKSFEVINSRKYNINTNKKSDECTGENSKDAMDVDTEEEDDYMVNNHPTQETVHPLGLSSDMQGVVVTSCVRMMKFPIDRDTMHALMRICLRYTQDHANALLFEIEGGVKILLESAHSTSYTGFVNLATLLIRHVIEEPRTLRYAMEYVLRIRTMPNIPPTYRELFYMSCNQLSAAIARDPVVFQTMASDVLRIDVNSLAKRQDDTRPLVKCIPQTELKAPLMKDFVATRCIYDLLNALVLPSPGNTSAPLGRDNAQYQGDSSSPDEGPIIMTISRPPPRPEPLILPLLGHSHRVRRIVGQPHIDMLRSNHTGNDTSHTETPEDDIPDSNRPFRDSIQSNIKVTEDEPKRPLLPKSVILKILAEAVRSYSTVPQLITDYNYQPGQSPLITEETKALAFILDKMLPIDNAVDRECSSTARMLIAAIASATDVPASQLSVVHEVKLALQRALAMPEGIEKHNQLQMLTGLIPTMLENCPPENPGLLKLHQHNPRKNGIYSIMVRKGLISDLARLPQNLDLSSPNMVATLNATLKPLESLLRISNQPVPVNSKFIKSKTQRRTTEVPGVSLSGVTNSEATHAQGDDMGVEDSESTDHDVSGTGENLEPTSEVDALDDVPHVTGLEEIMDQLLEQDTLESDHSYRPVRSGHVNINRNIGDEQPNIENIGYNPDRDATEDMISSDSGDSNEDSNGSEQDEREMEEDADDNDDEGELENDPYDYDDPLEFYDDEVAHSLFRRDRENEEVLMIHYQDPDNEAEPEGSGRNLVHWHSSNNSSAFSLPFGLLDDQPAAGEGSGVSQNQQLSMTRQNVDPGSVQFSRTHRTNRQRRYQYLHLNSRTSNPPVILQRLLGTAGQNMSMSASPITSGSGFRDSTRVLVMDNGIGIFTNNHEEEQIDFVDQSGYLFGPTLSAALSNTPTALHWWHHEATLLDGDSKFHLGFYLCTKILRDLEKHKGIELAKTRGKRKKRQEEIEPIATPKVFQGTQSTCSDSVRSSAGRGLSRSRDFAEITSGFLSSLSNILPAVNADQENLGFDTPLNNTETQSSSSSAVSPQTDETSSVTCTEANSITSSAVPVGDVAPLYQINRPDDDLSENNATVSNNQLSMTGVRESVPLYQMMHRSTTRPVDNSSDSNSLHINQTMNTDSNSEIVETVPPTTLRSVVDLAENNSSGSFKSITVGTETPEFKSLESDLSDPISNNSTLMEQNSSDNYSQSLPPPLFLTNDTNNTLSFSIPDPFVPPRLEINFSSSDEAEEQLNRVRVRRRYAPQTDPPPDEELVLRLNSLESEEQLVLRLESSESDNQLVLHIDSSESEEQLVLRLDSNEPDERLALHIDASESEGRLVLHIDTSESDQTTSCIASASLPVPGIRSYQSNNQMRLIDSDESTVILSPKEATNEYNIESVESAEGYTSVDSPLTVRSPEGLTTAESSESDEQLMCISSFPAPTVSEVQTPQVPSATFPDITISSDESSPVKDHSSARSVHCPLGGESTQQISQMPIQLEDQPRPSTSRTIDIAIAGSSSGVSDIPEGVDPSFLNALPAEVRAEVIEDHIRQQRREAQCARVQDAPLGLSEVSPEFLAALPPSIQEEVLAQQRMELQRQAAAAANPDDPVDAAAFFQNLQPSLRQAILTDMDESQISSLPPDIAAEAQNLRRDLESRNRQLMHERFLQQNALSSILRTGRGVRGARYAIHSLPQRAGHWAGGPYSRTDGNPSNSANMTTIIANMERLGRPLLDHESLTCLLVLLFIDEPKFNTLRLHRVIRNLCYHVPTRDWVIKSLLSIIEKCNENSDPYPLRSLNSVDRPQWLNISLDAALGCRANVFLMKRVITRRQKSLSPISIHPQAAAVVCKHTLELLISLAKSFPSYFLPLKSNQPKKDVEASTSGSNATKGSKHESEGRPTTDFWEILVKLDTSSGQSRKGKGAIRISKEFGEADGAPKSFETSLFGQLITMLSYNVIRKSSQLTDKLLRLISLISSELHFNPFCAYNANKNKLPVVLEEDCLPESEEHLKLAIQVLTSKSCSEEGLEDATALLLNLSHYSEDTRHLILRLLMDGAISLGVMVKSHIAALMKELKAMRVKTQEKLKDDASSGDSLKALKGVLKDRFTRNAVIVAAPTKMKIACELQLPAMAPLISKTSSQAFFLRILKVICQIRDAIKEAVNKKISLKSGQKASRSNIESNTSSEIAMDISAAECASLSSLELKDYLSVLSDSLDLDVLWDTLSECLLELEETPDHHAVLVLQPAVEAFFLVHSASQSKKRSGDSTNDQVDDAPVQLESEHGSQVTATSETSSEPAVGDHASASNTIPMVSGSPQSVHSIDSFEIAPLSPLESNVENSLDLANTARASSVPSTSLLTYVLVDKHKFLSFAETHRTVLNQILRQTTTHLSDGPFSVLVDHTRVLDFDVKRRYFRTELERLDEGIRREELAVHVRRSNVFEDSFRELYRRNPEEWKNRFYIVFEDEEGQDAGGLLREWYVIISRDIFNPNYALFTVSPGDRVTYMINSSSHCNPNHLCYFKFVGRVIAKAIYDNKLLECYFTRSFYKQILGIQVKHTDMESEDYTFYKSLVYLMEHQVADIGYECTFSTEIQEFGVTEVRDLIPNGRNKPVTEVNKHEYIRLVCQMQMCGAIRQQLNAFLEGFYEIIPKRLISIFNEQELELLISGLPNVDIEDLKANTEYHKYQTNSIQIQWFWRSLRSFDQADRAKFLQFVTGTSKVPLQGFAALEGMNGVQKFQIHRDDRSTDRLPSAHTCFNQLDLPVYETYDKLRSNLLKAIHECSEGFGFA